MSNSRSIASARQRRSGETPQQMNSSRPGTSIASQSAFISASPNVRNAKTPVMEQQTIQSNGLPFTKLTISDAIGLITLRLGKVEQFIIDTQSNGGVFNNDSDTHSNNKVTIDNSVLTSIVSRIDSLEKKQLISNSSVSSNSNNTIALENVNGEKIGKLEKELRDTKDLLMSFIMKCDLLTRETGQRFSEIETAISGIEKYIQPTVEDTVTSSSDVYQEIINNITGEDTVTSSSDVYQEIINNNTVEKVDEKVDETSENNYPNDTIDENNENNESS
jgi:hypothetical protein